MRIGRDGKAIVSSQWHGRVCLLLPVVAVPVFPIPFALAAFLDEHCDCLIRCSVSSAVEEQERISKVAGNTSHNRTLNEYGESDILQFAESIMDNDEIDLL